MGYVCPVCSEPFGGAEALANHLAVTALLRAGDHEQWLSETADSWGSLPRAELATLVAEEAEPTADHDHPGERLHEHHHEPPATAERSTQRTPAVSMADAETLDFDGREILREAQALTAAMQPAETQDQHPAASADDAEPASTDDTETTDNNERKES